MKKKSAKATVRLTAACLLLGICVQTWASPQDAKGKPDPVTQRDRQVLSSEAFLSDHPDMLNRLRGMQALERGDHLNAAAYFRRAARYADKQAQAVYAEMLWDGRGVPQDRPAAYAWMDLAAERDYKIFLVFRERYWNALSASERERALEIGRQVYAEYGDEVAQPRLEKILRRASRNITGSRTGSVGALTIIIPGPGDGTVIDGSTYYDKRYWEPAQYWQWQKQAVEGVKEGRVLVGDLRRTPEEAEKAAREAAKSEQKGRADDVP